MARRFWGGNSWARWLYWDQYSKMRIAVSCQEEAQGPGAAPVPESAPQNHIAVVTAVLSSCPRSEEPVSIRSPGAGTEPGGLNSFPARRPKKPRGQM